METPYPFSRVIITDFGLAKHLESSFERMNTKCGTINYLAPEILDPSGKGDYSRSVVKTTNYIFKKIILKRIVGHLEFYYTQCFPEKIHSLMKLKINP